MDLDNVITLIGPGDNDIQCPQFIIIILCLGPVNTHSKIRSSPMKSRDVGGKLESNNVMTMSLYSVDSVDSDGSYQMETLMTL